MTFHKPFGVPQGSISAPLLSLFYVNDLLIISKILDPIMFADDTNLFFSNGSTALPSATGNS